MSCNELKQLVMLDHQRNPLEVDQGRTDSEKQEIPLADIVTFIKSQLDPPQQ